MAVPEVIAAKQKLEDVIRRLRGAGQHGWARELEGALRRMNGWYDTKEALFTVGGYCHPRALGDMGVPGLTGKQWLDHVGELEGACAKAFHVLEQLPPGQRDSV